MSAIKLKNVIKRYGSVQVVHGVDLDIDKGEFVVLLGPSGCGKTTTLRMVAGLEDVSEGELWIGTKLVNEVPPKDRGVAMVFQNYALYPHMTVRQNMEFALRPLKLDLNEVSHRIAQTSEILGLTELLERRPAQLSGGQRQRVAMGRAMVRTPDVFLFDEPLSNLDAKLRTQVRWEIGKLHKRLGTTVLYVTHDQVEAMTLADKIVIMKDGFVEQVGTPEDVYTNPQSIFVATFIGTPSMNIFDASVTTGQLTTPDFSLNLPAELTKRLGAREKVKVGIRPSSVKLLETKESGSLEAIVEVIEYLGNDLLLDLKIGSQEIVAEVPANRKIQSGETVHILLDVEKLHFFDAETGKVINLENFHA